MGSCLILYLSSYIFTPCQHNHLCSPFIYQVMNFCLQQIWGNAETWLKGRLIPAAKMLTCAGFGFMMILLIMTLQHSRVWTQLRRRRACDTQRIREHSYISLMLKKNKIHSTCHNPDQTLMCKGNSQNRSDQVFSVLT